jgi:hypothetical protein
MLARQPVPTIGVIPTDDSERLIKAATTVLTEGLDDAETRLARPGVLNRWKRRVGAPTTRCRPNRWLRVGCAVRRRPLPAVCLVVAGGPSLAQGTPDAEA